MIMNPPLIWNRSCRRVDIVSIVVIRHMPQRACVEFVGFYAARFSQYSLKPCG